MSLHLAHRLAEHPSVVLGVRLEVSAATGHAQLPEGPVGYFSDLLRRARPALGPEDSKTD